jgi:hypothetical protein
MTRGMVCETITPPGRRLMPWMYCLNLRSCFGSFFFPLSFSDERHAHPGPSSFFLIFPLGTFKATRYLVVEKSLGWFLAFIDLPPPTGKRRTAVRALATGFSCGHNLLPTKLLPCCVVWHHPHSTSPTHIGNLLLGNGAFFFLWHIKSKVQGQGHYLKKDLHMVGAERKATSGNATDWGL